MAAPAPRVTLSPASVQTALGRQRAAFGACVDAAAAQGGGGGLEGRRVALLVIVNANGLVDAAEVEEDDLKRERLGACLARVAARLLFPPFDGEPVAVRVPLLLGAPRPAQEGK